MNSKEYEKEIEKIITDLGVILNFESNKTVLYLFTDQASNGLTISEIEKILEILKRFDKQTKERIK